jgi:hypothetical protein
MARLAATGRSIVAGRSAVPAQHLHLSRAARVAGEAFAFIEPESSVPQGMRLSLAVFLWPAAGIAALAAALLVL